MKEPDWRQFELDDSICREPSPERKQLVLWLRGNVVDGFQEWERIGTVLGAEIIVEHGLCRTQASMIRARQKLRSVIGRLLNSFRKPQGERVWLLPNGDAAEQIGERENDRILVWAELDADTCDEQCIREQWGPTSEVRRLGKNLFVVLKRESSAETAAMDDLPAEIRPMNQAMEMLAQARKSGDCLKQAPPLIDLGIICVQNGKIPQAIALLQRALDIARRFNDRSLESDAQTNLAIALLAGGQLDEAQRLLKAELAWARETGERYQEKIVLTHLAAVHAKWRDHASAFAIYEQALALARQLGDRIHEPELLWFLSIQSAELGRREQAIAFGHTALSLWREMDNPSVHEYFDSLEKYQSDVANGRPPLIESREPDPSQETDPHQLHGPGLLRMAISVTKSAVKFLASGMKTASTSMYESRLDVCSMCPHHTGVRCKLCGCFTRVKARVPHEQCPMGKWSTS